MFHLCGWNKIYLLIDWLYMNIILRRNNVNMLVLLRVYFNNRPMVHIAHLTNISNQKHICALSGDTITLI